MPPETEPKAKKKSIFAILKGYKLFIGALALFALLVNAGNLILPKIIARGIDAYIAGHLNTHLLAFEFGGVALLIAIFTYAQSFFQTYASERVARDLREDLIAKISTSSYTTVEAVTPSKLLTNLTSDVDAVKTFVSQAFPSIVSSVTVLIGASILLLSINWRLALAVIAILPVIGIVFFSILSKMKPFFKRTQEVIDKLNKVINESILGAAIIRVLHSEESEHGKFTGVNAEARDIGLSILKLFALVIPAISLIASSASVIILSLGGKFVINGSMTLGSFAAFTSYVGILIFPVLILGFMSNVIARAGASYERVSGLLDAPSESSTGTKIADLSGKIDVKEVSLELGGRTVLDKVSLHVAPGTKTAIIGPTAAGKTQLLYLLIGLAKPKEGTVEYDNISIADYDEKSLHERIGFVFQDSSIFNLTLRENIAFSEVVTDESMQRAIETAELGDFVKALPQGLETIVSERGTSLSGGQKQRIMLARALAIEPRILLLDDFTARVDAATELKILNNLSKNYPKLTLVSVTQKVNSASAYDSILLLMEGEAIAEGTHEELLKTSPEYVQIVESQKSTHTYELHT